MEFWAGQDQGGGRQEPQQPQHEASLTRKNRRNRLHFYLIDCAADRNFGEAQHGIAPFFDHTCSIGLAIPIRSGTISAIQRRKIPMEIQRTLRQVADRKPSIECCAESSHLEEWK
jgi:hypothetical protein